MAASGYGEITKHRPGCYPNKEVRKWDSSRNSPAHWGGAVLPASALMVVPVASVGLLPRR